MRTPDHVLVDLFTREAVQEREVVFAQEVRVGRRFGHVHLADRRHERDNLDSVREFEVTFGDRAGSDTTCRRHFSKSCPAVRFAKKRKKQPGEGERELTDRFTGTTPSSSTARLESVLEQVGPIGVRRARVVVGFSVVVGTLVLVADEETDRSAERDARLDTRLQEDLVGFVALHGGRSRRVESSAMAGSRDSRISSSPDITLRDAFRDVQES